MTVDTHTGLDQRVRGRIIGPDHPDYDTARAVFNGMIDKRPALIVQCQDAADVVACVGYARESGLAVAVRGGGHSGPGLGTVDCGLVIDLSPIRGVRVDPARRTVRVGAGCTAADVDHATHAYGLAVPLGIVGSTGVAGEGGYVNFMQDDGDQQRLSASYGANYPTLVALKSKYDPDNSFHQNQNIPPAR